MREIKFRAIKQGERKFVYGYFVRQGGFDYIVPVSGFNNKIRVVWNTAQQFTGLKDKNGKEIYEGDVLAIENGRTPEAGVFEVMWENCMFVLNWHIRNKQEKEPILNQENVDGLYIIGNVFENKDLLK